MSENIVKNSKYEILTPNGWSDFAGIKKNKKTGGVKISLGKKELVCSKGHRLKQDNDVFIQADEIAVGDILSDGNEVTWLESLPEEEMEYFDLLDVEKEQEYYTNGIVSHNCAHIPENMITALWLSVYPSLSTGGSAILISTPNGTENLFYRIWSDAKEGKNEFITMELPWTVHPHRDQDWYDKDSAITRAAKGERGILQEYHCVFIGSGDTFINGDVLAELEKNCTEAPENHPLHRKIKMWKRVEEGKKYLITSDVASGTAADYTTLCVTDLMTGEVVAEFKEKMPPQEFAPLMRALGEYYNVAVLCPEMNSYGLIVSEEIRKAKYPKLYFEKMNSILEVESYEPEQFEMPGWKTHEGSRPDMLAKLDYMLSTGKMKINSKDFIDELKNFVWKNNKPQAAKNKNDDLVICYAIAAKLLSTTDEELIAGGVPLIPMTTLTSMIDCLALSQSSIDLNNKTISRQREESPKTEQSDPTKMWNWIF